MHVCVGEQGEMKRGGPLHAAMSAVRFGMWESRLPPLQKVRFDRGSVPRREMGGPLPFWMLPQLPCALGPLPGLLGRSVAKGVTPRVCGDVAVSQAQEGAVVASATESRRRFVWR